MSKKPRPSPSPIPIFALLLSPVDGLSRVYLKVNTRLLIILSLVGVELGGTNIVEALVKQGVWPAIAEGYTDQPDGQQAPEIVV